MLLAWTRLKISQNSKEKKESNTFYSIPWQVSDIVIRKAVMQRMQNVQCVVEISINWDGIYPLPTVLILNWSATYLANL